MALKNLCIRCIGPRGRDAVEDGTSPAGDPATILDIELFEHVIGRCVQIDSPLDLVNE